MVIRSIHNIIHDPEDVSHYNMYYNWKIMNSFVYYIILNTIML